MAEGKILLTIGEVARSIGVTRRMILNYENRGLVRPDVKEGESGNRYYTSDTLVRIRTIRILQDMGLSLDEIRDYFDDSTDLRPLIARLENLRDELNLNIEKLRAREKGTVEPQLTILPRQTVYCADIRGASIAEKKAQLSGIVAVAMRRYGTDTGKRMFFIEYPLDYPESIVCYVTIPEGNVGESVSELEECQALCIYHHGAYEELPAVREALLAVAEERGLLPLGVCRHIYLEGPPQHKDPKKFITQVALPVAERIRNQTST